MLDDEDTYTLGPLIHNPKVVEELDANGVHVAEWQVAPNLADDASG